MRMWLISKKNPVVLILNCSVPELYTLVGTLVYRYLITATLVTVFCALLNLKFVGYCIFVYRDILG